MWRTLITIVVSLAVPAGASAGPLREAVEKTARELSLAQQPDADTGSRGRFWTGIALLAGAAVLTTLGSVELGDDEDESGPDDEEDFDESDDGEDEDVNKVLIGSGVAAAAAGGWLLITGRRSAVPSVSTPRGSVVVRHTVRF